MFCCQLSHVLNKGLSTTQPVSIVTFLQSNLKRSLPFNLSSLKMIIDGND